MQMFGKTVENVRGRGIFSNDVVLQFVTVIRNGTPLWISPCDFYKIFVMAMV